MPLQQRRTFICVSQIMLVGIAIGSLLGFCGQLGPWFDIFSEFRACYILLLLVLIVMVVWTKRPGLIAGSLLLLIVNGLSFVPLYFGESHRSHSGRYQLRILELNVFGKNNRQTGKTLELIEHSNADIIGVSEVTDQWMQVFQKDLKQYPYQIYEPRFGGVALLSKLPLKNSSVKYFGVVKRPRITTSICISGWNVQIIFAHPVIPLYKNGLRDEEIIVLAGEANSASGDGAVILFGDLNVTSWSHSFHKLVKDSGLIDSANGFGFQPTWCAFLSPVLTLFPIDHCLVTDDFLVVDRCLLGNIGSDHSPLQVDLAFKR